MKGYKMLLCIAFPIDVGPWCELNMIPLLQKDLYKNVPQFSTEAAESVRGKRQKLLTMSWGGGSI